MSRSAARVAALVAALVLSKSQDRFFDCNKLPFLSYAAGVVTLVIVYGTAEQLHAVVTSQAPDGKGAAVATILNGCGAAGGAGCFTLVTHLCP